MLTNCIDILRNLRYNNKCCCNKQKLSKIKTVTIYKGELTNMKTSLKTTSGLAFELIATDDRNISRFDRFLNKA